MAAILDTMQLERSGPHKAKIATGKSSRQRKHAGGDTKGTHSQGRRTLPQNRSRF